MFLRLSRQITLVILGAIVLPPSVTFAQHSPSTSPTAIVRSFYKFHFSHDMGFAKRNIRRRRAWLTPALFQLLMNEFRRDEQYAKAHPSETYVPYMEGDPFTNSQALPDAFRVGRSELSGNKATVAISMLWTAKNPEGPDERKLNIQLLRIGSKWLINNVVNQADGDDLVADLKRKEYLP